MPEVAQLKLLLEGQGTDEAHLAVASRLLRHTVSELVVLPLGFKKHLTHH